MSNPAGSSTFVANTGHQACSLGTDCSSKGAANNELKVDLIVLNWSVALAQTNDLHASLG